MHGEREANRQHAHEEAAQDAEVGRVRKLTGGLHKAAGTTAAESACVAVSDAIQQVADRLRTSRVLRPLSLLQEVADVRLFDVHLRDHVR